MHEWNWHWREGTTIKSACADAFASLYADSLTLRTYMYLTATTTVRGWKLLLLIVRMLATQSVCKARVWRLWMQTRGDSREANYAMKRALKCAAWCLKRAWVWLARHLKRTHIHTTQIVATQFSIRLAKSAIWCGLITCARDVLAIWWGWRWIYMMFGRFAGVTAAAKWPIVRHAYSLWFDLCGVSSVRPRVANRIENTYICFLFIIFARVTLVLGAAVLCKYFGCFSCVRMCIRAHGCGGGMVINYVLEGRQRATVISSRDAH